MATVQQPRATLDDLRRTSEKAELIGGRIVTLMLTGFRPGRVAFRIAQSLDRHATQTGQGVALPDNAGFVVLPLPSGRVSFSPNAAYYVGPLPADPMRFIEGPPTLAVEVRSENDYGPAAEANLAAKRADYFAAGTQVVWDVDPRAETVTAYQAAAPAQPVTYRRGEVASAEPAVPGWWIAVDEVFA